MRLNYTSLNRSPTSLSYLLSSGFKPASLFAQSEPGVWLDPSDVADLAWRRNLLTYSEQFNNAAWVKTRTTVTPNAVIAPDGTLTADTLTASANDPYIQQDIVANSRTYTWSVYLKGAGSSIGRRPLLRITRDAYTEVLNSSGLPLLTANWQRYVFSATFVSAPVASVGARVDFVEDNDIGFTVDFWGAQIELGSTATPYQRISDVTTEVLERFPTTTLFQDTAGTTPVTTPGQPVGLVLDKSKNGVGTNGSARRNIYSFTEQFDSTFWTKNGSTVTADGADWLLIPTATTSTHGLSGSVTSNAGVVHTLSFEVQTGYTQWARLALIGGTDQLNAWFDLANTTKGSFTTSASMTYVNHTITNLGNGWRRITLSGIPVNAGGTTVTWLMRLAQADLDAAAWLADGTSFNRIGRPQLELGSTATPYQRITADWTSTIPGNHATQATSASRPTYGVHPTVGLRNLAHGSADVSNTTYWPATLLNNGITATKIASGFDTDGLPYVDVRYQGTSTATFHSSVYSTLLSRTTAAAGQTFTASASLQRIGGSLTNLGPLTLILTEETAPSTFVNQSASPGTVETYPVMDTVSRTLVSGNQVRVGFVLNFSSGVTIDATFRIKGLQLELGSSRTAYQFNYNRFNVTEAGVASVSYLSFDGTNSWLVTPTIDPAASAIPGAELVTNGTFASDTNWTKETGWSISGGAASKTSGTAGSLYQGAAAMVQGRTYQIDFTVSGYSAGTLTPFCRGTGGTGVTANGTYSQRIIAGADSVYVINFFAGATFVGSIDNISVREIVADKVQVFAGVRKLGDAAIGVVVELSADTNSNNGTIWMIAPQTAGAANANFASKGTILAGATRTDFAAPVTAVMTGLGNISGDLATLRVNGIQAAQSTADQGTGNYLSYPLYIGRRGGTSLPFNGQIYSLIVRFGANLATDQIASIESSVGSKTGFFAPTITGVPTIGVS